MFNSTLTYTRIAMLVATVLGGTAPAAWAQGGSCDPVHYPSSCFDKVMGYVVCTAKEAFRLRALPSYQSQAVGDVDEGDEVVVAARTSRGFGTGPYISDTALPGAWLFIQGSGTHDGSTNGGWLLRSALVKCRRDVP